MTCYPKPLQPQYLAQRRLICKLEGSWHLFLQHPVNRSVHFSYAGRPSQDSQTEMKGLKKNARPRRKEVAGVSSISISLPPNLGPLREKEIKYLLLLTQVCLGFLANRRRSAGYQVMQVIKKWWWVSRLSPKPAEPFPTESSAGAIKTRMSGYFLWVCWPSLDMQIYIATGVLHSWDMAADNVISHAGELKYWR